MPFSPKRAGSVTYSLVMFAIVSVLAGVLIAGLFVPFAGIAGVSTKAAATELDALPAELSTPAPPTRSRVLMADGKTLAYFYSENRIPVKLDQIAPVMRQAQLAIEDHRYYEHGALDFKGTLRAFVRNSTSDGGTQGGSSITQQYVKMVQIEACEAKADDACVKEARAATMERKIRELRYAIALEKKFTKDEILERYLNIAYYGEGAYGVEAAARHYFSTSASKLNLAQAAMLAGLVQNPDASNPVRNPSAALDRRDVVINRMFELKLITAGQVKKTKAVGFDQKLVKPTRNGCVGTKFPFLCDYVYRTLLAAPSLGETVKDRENMVNRGGLTIQTAIDPKTQAIAQDAVSKVVGATDPIISTMNMIQPGTGLIIAMAQSRPVMGTSTKKGESYYNYSVEQSMGGAEGYQAGSTFKAFTAAAALEKGIPLSKRYNARSPMDFSNYTFSSCLGSVRSPGYRPKNSTGVNGNMDMMKGAAASVNTYFLQLEQTVGICPVTKMAKKLGVQLSDPKLDLTTDPRTQVPSFTLGVSEVTPLSMAEAYATFAARGMHCDPIIISKITTRTGKNLDPPSANCKQVISKDVADGMNKLLSNVMVGRGTGTRARIPGISNQAGKTGTINGNHAVWFNGYTSEIAGAAMIAIDPTRSTWKSGYRKAHGVLGYRLPSTGVVLEGSGSGDAGMKIWKPAMTAAMKGLPDTAFKKPSTTITRGKQVQVPSLYGLSLAAARAKLTQAGFTVEKRYVYDASVPKYSFMYFSPGGGSTVPQFSTVYETYSRGEDPAIARARAQAAADARKAAAAAKKAAEAKAKADAAAKAKAKAKASAPPPPPGG
ncbi:MAG: penicillin-binding protein [Friedmanniella sp.]|nr:penicillin-binding protein [Friedmanniella sp.]